MMRCLIYRGSQTKFTTGNDNHVGDEYFLTSGDKIRYFLEEEAIDSNGKLTRAKDKAVNKIGHGMHGMTSLSMSPSLTDCTRVYRFARVGSRLPQGDARESSNEGRRARPPIPPRSRRYVIGLV